MSGEYLSESMHKSRISLAYVNALASWAGYEIQETVVDLDSVDCRIAGRHDHDADVKICDPTIYLQVKATSKYKISNDNSMHFKTDIRTYNNLRKRVRNPRFLVVLLLPEDPALWIEQDQERMISRKCAYYHSLDGHPPVSNKESTTILIPRVQIFSAPWLAEIMHLVAQELI